MTKLWSLIYCKNSSSSFYSTWLPGVINSVSRCQHLTLMLTFSLFSESQFEDYPLVSYQIWCNLITHYPSTIASLSKHSVLKSNYTSHQLKHKAHLNAMQVFMVLSWQQPVGTCAKNAVFMHSVQSTSRLVLWTLRFDLPLHSLGVGFEFCLAVGFLGIGELASLRFHSGQFLTWLPVTLPCFAFWRVSASFLHSALAGCLSFLPVG